MSLNTAPDTQKKDTITKKCSKVSRNSSDLIRDGTSILHIRDANMVQPNPVSVDGPFVKHKTNNEFFENIKKVLNSPSGRSLLCSNFGCIF